MVHTHFDAHFLIPSIDKYHTCKSSLIGCMVFCNNMQVIFGLFTSIILFAMMAWMIHDPHPRMFKSMVTSPSILELVWISAHSTTLHDFMTRTDNSMSDQLRIQGVKTEVCLLDLNTGPTRCHSDEGDLGSTSYFPNWKQFIAQGQFGIIHSVYQITGEH